MESKKTKLYFATISLLSVLLITGLGFGIFSQSQNNTETISEFRGGFIQFASATHDAVATFSSTTTVEGSNATITLVGTSSHSASLGFGPSDVTMMNAGEGMLTANPTLDGPEPIRFVVVTYLVPNDDYNGMTSFTFTVTDDGGTTFSAPATVNVFVTAVNDAPVNTAPDTETMNEDEVLEFLSGKTSEMSITDVDFDDPGCEECEAQAHIVATSSLSLSSLDGLTFSGGSGVGDSSMTFTGSISDINTALDGMTYTPDEDFNGEATVTITTNDKGNTGSGGVLSDEDTVNITITPVNDEPTLGAIGNPAAIDEDAGEQEIAFSGITAGATNEEDGQTTTVSVSSDDETLTGALTLVYTDDAAAGSVKYTPVGDANGSTIITVTVNDGAGTPNGGDDEVSQTFTVTVDAVNDAPVNTAPDTETMNEDEVLEFLSGKTSEMSITDVDFDDPGCEECEAQAHIVATSSLSLSSLDGLTFSGGSGVGDSSMTFTGSISDINTALDGMTYTPDEDFNGEATVTITTNDKGNTGSGGALVETSNVTITVNAINDAPVLDTAGVFTLTNINEDNITSAGDTVATIISSAGGDRITDVDATPVEGIAVIGVDDINGTWEYSTNGGTTFTPFGAVSGSSAVLLDPSGLVRFVPDADYNGSAGNITFRAWDQTAGASGDTGVDVSTNGLTTAYSSATDTATLTVNVVNDEPSFTTSNQEVPEDSGDASVAIFTTFNPGPADESGQTATYTVSNNNNALFSTQPSVSPSGTLTYRPADDANGVAIVTISVKDSGGTANGGDDTSPDQTFNITVTAVNDAPTISKPSTQLTDEDTPLTFGSANINTISISDIDAAEGTGVVSLNIVATSSLTLATDTGLTFSVGDGFGDSTMTFTGTVDVINTSLSGLIYGPTLNANDAQSDPRGKIDITVNDLGQTGSGGPLGAMDSVAINITPVNDPPTAVNDTFGPTDEDSPLAAVSGLDTPGGLTGDGVLFNDLDVDLTIEGDTRTVTKVEGASASVGMEITLTSGALLTLNSDGGFTYNPNGAFEFLDEDEPDTDSFTYTMEDTAGVSPSTATVTINITGVNDAPEITIVGDTTFNFDEAGTPLYDDDSTTPNSEGAVAGGATVTDVEDDFNTRALTIITTDLVDPENPGTYTVTYDVTDNDPTVSAQRTDQQIRTVIVRDTTPPVLTLTTTSATRVEGDDTLGATNQFSFDVIADDSPRETYPEITCVDEDGTTLINKATADSSASPTYGLGITTVTCTADDLSNVEGDPEVTDLDLSLNDDTDSDSIDYAVTEIFFDPLSPDDTPFWEDDITASGEVYGFLVDEQIRVTFGNDAVYEFTVPYGDYDSNGTTDTGQEWSQTHAFSKATSDTEQSVSVLLFSNPTQATTSSQTATVLKHTSAIVQGPDIPNDEFWGFPTQKSGTLIETIPSLSGNLITTSYSITFSDNGKGTFPDETLTSAGAFLAFGKTAFFVSSSVTLAMGFEGNNLYDPAADVYDYYNTLPRTAELTIDDLESISAGTNLQITGDLIDTAFEDVALPFKDITFGAIVSKNPDDNPIAGISIEEPTETSSEQVIIIGDFEIGKKGQTKVYRPVIGDLIHFPGDPQWLSMTLEGGGNTEVTVKVFPVDGTNPTTEIIETSGNNGGGFSSSASSGVSKLEILDVASLGNGGFSKIELKNIDAHTTFVTEFESVSTPVTPGRLSLGGGEYDTVGLTGIGEGYTLKIQALLNDKDYVFTSSDTATVKIAPNIADVDDGAGEGGVGAITSVTADSGIGITSVICEFDSDLDALCDQWEDDYNELGGVGTEGIPYDVDGFTHYYELPGTSVNTQDLLLEIDAMPDHLPPSSALSAIEAVFADNDIKLHYDLTAADEITHDVLTKVWQDSALFPDLNLKNDFNGIKSIYFGNVGEHVDATGTQSNSVKTQKLLLPLDGVITDSANSVATSFSGTELYVNGNVKDAFDFNGSTHITTEDTPFDFDQGDAFSIATWFNTDEAVESDFIFGKINGSGVGYQLLFISADDMRFRLSSSGSDRIMVDTVGINVRDTGLWHHVAVTYDGSSADTGVKIYIDGTAVTLATVGSNNSISASTLNAEPLVFGAKNTSGGGHFTGQLDEIQVFEFELTADQVDSIHDSAILLPISGYSFEDNLTEDVYGLNDGTVDGTAIFVAEDIDGDAFDFNGSTEIQTADAPFDFDRGDPFSIATWFKTDVQGASDWLAGKLPSSDGYQLFLDSSDQIRFRISSANNNKIIIDTVGQSVRDDEWHHVILTYDGSSTSSGVNIYVDGVASELDIVSDATLVNTITTNEVLVLGNKKPGGKNNFDGQMDDFKVFAYEISESQVAEIMNPRTKILSLATIGDVALTTPQASVLEPANSDDKTEGSLRLKALVTSAGDSLLYQDTSRDLSIDDVAMKLTFFDPPSMSSSETVLANENILTVKIPYLALQELSAETISDVTVPLETSSAITAITTHLPATASSTLLEAKAQGFRFIESVHSIGGSSGQSELRGNDAIVALGEGFGEIPAAGHDGTEGFDAEFQGTIMHEIGHLLNLQHGGPRYELSDPNTTLATAALNCVPIHPSVMSYTSQMTTYKQANWSLDYSHRNGDRLAEDSDATDGTTEALGIVLGDAFFSSPTVDYQFDGSNLNDSTGNVADGTTVVNSGGSELYLSDLGGQVFDFNGSTHIETADSLFDFDKDDAFSIAAWFNTDETVESDFIFGKMSGAGAGYQLLFVSADDMRFRLSSSGSDRIMVDTVGINVRDTGLWHHVAVTYDGSAVDDGVKIFIDGEEVTLATVSTHDDITGSPLNDELLVFGAKNVAGNGQYLGQMDDIQVFDYRLTTSQVEHMFMPPYIVWATPGESPTFLGDFAGPNLDLNGDGDLLDGAGVSFDLNNFGIPGCQTSTDDVYENFSEWDNLDFDFRKGVTGQFDGIEADLGEIGLLTVGSAGALVTDGDILQPINLVDGVGEFTSGSNVPIKAFLRQGILIGGSSETYFGAQVQVTIHKEGGGPKGEFPLVLGLMEDLQNVGEYLIGWDTVKKHTGTFGVELEIITPPGTDPAIYTLIDPDTPDQIINDDQVVTFKMVGIKSTGKPPTPGPDNTNPVITGLPIADPFELTLTDQYIDFCTSVDDDPQYVDFCFVKSGGIDTSVLGLQSVIYDANPDPSGNNPDDVEISSTIEDTTPPLISAPFISNPSELTNTDQYIEGNCTVFDNDKAYAGVCFVSLGGIDTSILGAQDVTFDAIADNAVPTPNAPAPVFVPTVIEDNTPPTFTLNGEALVTVPLGVETYTELHAAISDNDNAIDGTDTINSDRTITKDGLPYVAPIPIDTSTAAVYEITYNKTDPEGNPAAPVVRTVDVMNMDVLAPVITPDQAITAIFELENADSYVEGCTAADDDPNYIPSCGVESGGIDTSDLNGGVAQEVVYAAPADAAGNEESPLYPDGITDDNIVQLVVSSTIEDNTNPSLALNGVTPVSVVVGQVYTEEHAAISDNDNSIDGDDTLLTDRTIIFDPTGAATPVLSVDVNTLGIYEITYNKSDPSGNPADPVVRTVEVVADTVQVTLATYHTKSKWLDIEATASDPAAIFKVYDTPADIVIPDAEIGTMDNLGGGLYDFRLKGTDPGTFVTVASSVAVQFTFEVDRSK